MDQGSIDMMTRILPIAKYSSGSELNTTPCTEFRFEEKNFVNTVRQGNSLDRSACLSRRPYEKPAVAGIESWLLTIENTFKRIFCIGSRFAVIDFL